MFDRSKEIDEEYEIINYKVSATPQIKCDLSEVHEEEAYQQDNAKYNWMILIGRLKSLTKIAGKIQVHNIDRNQSQLYDGHGLKLNMLSTCNCWR